MSLKRREYDGVEFNEILKSKHARYIDGGIVVSKELIPLEYLPPGTILGKCTASGHGEEDKYGPVVRGEVDSMTHGTDTIVMETEEDLWGFQVGDKVVGVNSDGERITPHGSDDLEITAIDVATKTITVTALEDGSDTLAADYLQKDDGTSEALLVCTHGIDLRNEDQFVGGILHGAVHKDRLVNYDEFVDGDLPLISFE